MSDEDRIRVKEILEKVIKIVDEENVTREVAFSIAASFFGTTALGCEIPPDVLKPTCKQLQEAYALDWEIMNNSRLEKLKDSFKKV